MKKLIISVLATLFFATGTLYAQQDKVTDNKNPMNKLSFLLGEWEGTGWRMTQTGKREYTNAFEKVTCRLDCGLFIVEGLGVKTDSVTKESKTVHDAFGIIYHDAKTNSISMRAHTKDGITETVIEFLEEKLIRWNMDIPNGGKIRFTVDFKTANKWIEIGEFSRDGLNWMKFLETTLTKTRD
ncbi:MAG TPA: hypothetical protein PKY28_11715 [Ferruginibacter sp.]|nr:hypothetical protein [Chitinophagaceae bacterium]HQW93762.1 hypothetical protein [Ferruginibacter sp.]